MATPLPDPLQLLQQAQLLHDATLRRHGDLLDQHADQLVRLRALDEQQHTLMQQLATLQAKLDARQDDLAAHQRDHAQHMARLDAMLAAVLDLLRRGRNGS